MKMYTAQDMRDAADNLDSVYYLGSFPKRMEK